MQNGSSFMSLLDISNVARMPASGLASYSQEEGKEIRENQDSANVTKKIEDFRKPPVIAMTKKLRWTKLMPSLP